ncbi:MAG: TlpA family protein disulfide reductase [Campylobacteraceae bacterium]|nr:TlpA family protein disulfide reductase [Campylobacteraceae bacterium]
MKFKSSFILLFIVLVFIGCEKKEKEKTAVEPSEPVLMQNLDAPITLNLMNGNVLSIKKKDDGLEIDNGGKATLFVFFATWCPPCLVEIEPLNNLYEIYKDSIDIVGVLIQDEKSKEDMEFFIENFDIKYSVSLGSSNETLVNIIGGIDGIPYMVLYDGDGKQKKRYIGVIAQEMLDVDIKKTIK